MRISDWSSDVCSSDLAILAREIDDQARETQDLDVLQFADHLANQLDTLVECELRVLGDVAADRDDQFRVHLRRTLDDVEVTEGDWIEGAAVNRGDRHAIRSEEHTSELQSLLRISYAVFCLKKKKHSKSD